MTKPRPPGTLFRKPKSMTLFLAGWTDADDTVKAEWFEDTDDDSVMDYLIYCGHQVIMPADLERLEFEPVSVANVK